MCHGIAGAARQDRLRHTSAQQAVGHLPESLKEVLTLVYYQGLKYREAAEVLEIPVGTVKSRVSRARQLVMDELGGEAL